MSFVWSEEKQKLFNFDSDTLVSASAGTGKTTALVELYMRLLDGSTKYGHKVKPENILAITFTNKAAMEMRERILEQVDERQMEVDRQSLFLSSNIYTFHGFCQNVLREYAYEAGFSPDFEIVEDISRNKILVNTITSYLAEQIKNECEAVKQFLNSFTFGELVSAIQNIIMQLGGNNPRKLNESEEKKQTLTNVYKYFREYDCLVTELKSIYEGHSKAKSAAYWQYISDLIEYWPERYKKLCCESEQDEDSAVAFCVQWFKFEAQYKPRDAKPTNKLIAKAKRIRSDIHDTLNQLKVIPEIIALVGIVESILIQFKQQKQQKDLLDFNDLEQECIRLLEKDKTVLADIQKRFQVILVDEFQDTNQTQVKLLNLLKRDRAFSEKHNLPEARRLIVGDRKQSIYKFRGADVEIFRKIEEATVSEDDESIDGIRLHFKENYRSTPAMLKVFNHLSENIMSGSTKKSYEVNYRSGDDLVSGLADNEFDEEFPVDLILVNGSYSAEEAAVIEANEIAKLVKSYCSGKTSILLKNKDGQDVVPEYGDICILLRKRTRQHVFEQVFREQQIPLIIGQGTGLLDRQEIKDVENILKFFYQPMDRIARYATLRSPAVLLSDISLVKISKASEDQWLRDKFKKEIWLKSIRSLKKAEQERFLHFLEVVNDLENRKDYLPVSELIEEVFEKFKLKIIHAQSFEGQRRLANLEKFLDIVREWEDTSTGFGVLEFIERMELARVLGSKESEAETISSASSVSMMTIHQSKGLEFPIVILPELGNSKGRNNGSGNVAVNSKNKIVKKHFNTHEQAWESTIGYSQKKELDKLKEVAESQRLFYVAITRAKNHLVFSGLYKEKKDKKANKKENSTNWIDWVFDYVGHVSNSNMFHEDEKVHLNIINASDSVFHVSGKGYNNILALNNISDWADKFAKGFNVSENNLDSPLEESKIAYQKKDVNVNEDEGKTAQDIIDEYSEACITDYDKEMVGTFSVTNLRDLKLCERKYQLKHILEKSTLLWMEENNDLENLSNVAEDQTSQGILVHKYFELLPEEQKADKASWQKFLKAHGLNKDDNWAVKAGELIEIAGPWPSDCMERPERILKEVPFIAKLSLPSGRQIRVKGIIDVLKLYADNGFEIIDYKYASYRKQKEEAYQFQLQLYAEVIRNSFGGVCDYEKAWIGYLKDKKCYKEVDISPEKRGKFIEKLDEMVLRAKELDELKDIEWEDGGIIVCPDVNCKFADLCLK